MDTLTFSVTVAFNPDRGRLAAQLAALRGQVDAAIVVDNASLKPIEASELGPGAERASILRLPGNRGMAGGLNAGISAARLRGATRFLLLDDDSVPPAGMVDTLARALESETASDIAAVGPTILDARHRRPYPFIRLGWWRNQRLDCATEQDRISCDFLISSGTLVDASALDRLGGFDEGLFIDSVDFEWCCRARHAGYRLLGVCGTTLDHELGDDRRRVLGIAMVVHSPLRLYYMTRNRINLYGRAHIPLRWKLKDVLRMVLKNTATVLFISPRLQYLQMIGRGAADALLRRTGPHRSGDA